jgi:hypothetical protein
MSKRNGKGLNTLLDSVKTTVDNTEFNPSSYLYEGNGSPDATPQIASLNGADPVLNMGKLENGADIDWPDLKLAGSDPETEIPILMPAHKFADWLSKNNPGKQDYFPQIPQPYRAGCAVNYVFNDQLITFLFRHEDDNWVFVSFWYIHAGVNIFYCESIEFPSPETCQSYINNINYDICKSFFNTFKNQLSE